jgi:hypothetical protein
MTPDSWKSLIIKILLMILTPLAAQLHLSAGPSDLSAIAADLADLAVLLYGVYRTYGTKNVPHNSVAIAPHTPQDAAAPVGASAAGKVVGALLIAFALSFLVAAPSAQAQQVRRPAMTGDIAKDLKTDFGESEKPRLITGNAEKDAHAIWDKIVSASNADLKYASALAGKANTSASLVRKQCYDAILDLNTQVNGMNLTDADGKVLPQPDPKLFTGVEQAAETIDNLSPQGKLFTSCAGMAQLTKTNVLTLVNAIVTGAAGFAAMPIIPGL